MVKPFLTLQLMTLKIMVLMMMSSLGVEDVNNYSTHSIRKIKSSEIFKQTQNVGVCRRLLGHSIITAKSQYLGLEDSDALEVATNIII